MNWPAGELYLLVVVPLMMLGMILLFLLLEADRIGEVRGALRLLFLLLLHLALAVATVLSWVWLLDFYVPPARQDWLTLLAALALSCAYVLARKLHERGLHWLRLLVSAVACTALSLFWLLAARAGSSALHP